MYIQVLIYILAQQGLGKTLQSISIVGYLRDFCHINGPHLVICPKSTIGNWINEFKRWAPEINAKRFHGGKDDRVRLDSIYLFFCSLIMNLLPGFFSVLGSNSANHQGARLQEGRI
jgi:SNF2 family DNA or RNA helicase